jgi:hypothetical protein
MESRAKTGLGGVTRITADYPMADTLSASHQVIKRLLGRFFILPI